MQASYSLSVAHAAVVSHPASAGLKVFSVFLKNNAFWSPLAHYTNVTPVASLQL